MKLSENQLNKINSLPTPLFVYHLPKVRSILQAATNAAKSHNYHIHYALKANANLPILKEMHAFNVGADCVSGWEIDRAIEAGFTPNKIAFAGVGKQDVEIETALKHGIFSFNVESVQELDIINQLAANKGKKANIALRVNPDVKANTHHYITTGLEENKFGINPWEFDAVIEKLKTLNNIQLTGLHFHIGSQITDLDPFKHLCLRINELISWFEERYIHFQHINAGGGLGINYANPDDELHPDFDAYFGVFNKHLQLRPSQELHFELGRALIANAGDLLTRVLFIKNGIRKNFAIVDAGMTELIRPALYQAFHKIENISAANNEVINYDVVGPICESSDCFGKEVQLPPTKRGDLIAIRSVGAYGQVMSSQYNLRTLAAEYYFDE